MTDADPILDDSLRCPLCDYALVGLTSRRCPECGHAFDPGELRRRRDDGRDTTFEHSPRRVVAFFDATGRTLRPFEFWRRFSPTVPIVPRRLRLWAAVWLAFAATCLAIEAGPVLFNSYSANELLARLKMGGLSLLWDGAIRPMLRLNAPLKAATRLIVVAVAWPVVTFGAIRLFAITLRRAGVRGGHLWRVVLYAWPSLLMSAALAGVATLAFGWEGYGIYRGVYAYWLYFELGLSPATGACWFGMMIVSTLHLIAAHTRYLRLPDAVNQAMLVAAVAWLAIAGVLVAARHVL